jgi:hypothetical protein
MKFTERKQVEKQYVISESLVRLLKIAVWIGILTWLTLFSTFMYLIIRVESQHYPSRFITDLDKIANIS